MNALADYTLLPTSSLRMHRFRKRIRKILMLRLATALFTVVSAATACLVSLTSRTSIMK
ncbi:hypothetical protein M422DRAFT_26332 [Sphaerobolus stellatus SS14]|nr:hypothetical protein M422DRAFT_26332 [Sphaerobolus stellatus SS14]